MTGGHPKRPGTTHDQIVEILLAGDGVTNAELGLRLGIREKTVANVRKRRTWQAIKVAGELGLLPLSPRVTVWRGRSGHTERVSAYRAAMHSRRSHRASA